MNFQKSYWLHTLPPGRFSGRSFIRGDTSLASFGCFFNGFCRDKMLFCQSKFLLTATALNTPANSTRRSFTLPLSFFSRVRFNGFSMASALGLSVVLSSSFVVLKTEFVSFFGFSSCLFSHVSPDWVRSWLHFFPFSLT